MLLFFSCLCVFFVAIQRRQIRCRQNCKRFDSSAHFSETAHSIKLLVRAFDKFMFPVEPFFPIL